MDSFTNFVSGIMITSLFYIFFLAGFKASAAYPSYLYNICTDRSNFTRNSSYYTNLRTILSTLSSPNASYAAGFQNATAGRSPDTAYGLFLCRGDLSADVCRDCVAFAVNETLDRCPNQKESVIWYDECMLRYSHRNILSAMATDPGVYLLNNQNVSRNQRDRFNQLVASMMNDAANEAVNSSRKFAVKTANFTSFQTMYGLVQCTQDLSREDCDSCLRQAINQLPGCCGGRIGGRVLLVSCNVRYELYPFYNVSAPPIPPQSHGSPTPPGRNKSGRNGSVIVVAIVVPISVSVLLFIAAYCFLATRARKKDDAASADDAGNDVTTTKSLQFDFGTIEAATDKFSDTNKVGVGGFGEVFKGKLPNGQEIAVKRFSKRSAQGIEEFKNEVVLLARLQHKTLVRLLGYCLEGEEKMLVYEFVPNKSLDYFLFDPEKQAMLDWSRRYKIIGGIARGILYLHHDSRLKVVHRNLKTSSVLLDADMNPKISGFGIARLFDVDQTQGNTSRIAGTYGYMSPEYALYGQFSIKSDVYSFGIMVLEIISGKKIGTFYRSNGVGDLDLVSYAWKLWRDETPLELLDPKIADNYQKNEVVRCIHIGLLCVQEDPADRPTLANSIPMLNSFSFTLPTPQQPGFSLRSRQESNQQSNMFESDQFAGNSVPWSVDDASITELHPR